MPGKKSQVHSSVDVVLEKKIQGLPSVQSIKKFCHKLLSEIPFKSLNGVSVCVHVVSDARIKTLNNKYRKKNQATDVLSFPMQHFKGGSGTPRLIKDLSEPGLNLGDVIISVDTCKRQANVMRHSIRAEFDRLLVHGMLHLRGYDHEISPSEEKKMLKMENRLLARLSPGKKGLLTIHQK